MFSGCPPVNQGRTLASTELEPLTGVWGRSPQRGSRGRAPAGDQQGEAPLKRFVRFHIKEGPKDKDLNETI